MAIHLKSGDGPTDAKIMLVGESFSDNDERVGLPFQGPSGEELSRMLHEAGIMRSECYTTNVVNARAPGGDLGAWMGWKKKDVQADYVQVRGLWVKPTIREGIERLLQEIALVRPNLIIALGGHALWALTGATGIMKWRGSQLRTAIPTELWPRDVDPVTPVKLIPAIHPSMIARDWSQRQITVHDFKRAAGERDSRDYSNEPKWNFIVRPTINQALGTLHNLLEWLSSGQIEWIDFDLETRAGHIACAGLSWTKIDAICIPLMCVESRDGYWLLEEEAEILWLLYQVLTHPKVKVRGQNLLYDAQYTYRHWHFVPRVAQDTMIAQHSAFCTQPKSLAHIASMYCDHYVYWKDDGKTWTKDTTEDQLWRYNCVDCVRTREAGEVLETVVTKLGIESVNEFQQKFFWPVLQAMQRGVAIDKKLRQKLADELLEEMAVREEYFVHVLGHPFNPRSKTQMAKLFYEDLKQQPIWSRAKKGIPSHITCDGEALTKIALREPILRPFIKAIEEYRSLGVFLSTFVLAPLDIDNRMRTSYNITGTSTFRFSSSENAFGSGTNLQNIPKGGEEADSDLKLPNVRKMFVPDPGYEMFDKDLSKADLRIVVWESGEDEMKAMLKEGKDPYIEVARDFYKDRTINKLRSDGSEDPRYRTFKSFCHGTHYLGSPSGLSQRLGLTVYQAEKTQNWYFGRFPKIREWQNDFKKQVASRRWVENIFGYRCHFFGRIDDATFREAIAWVPQSTVALYINRIWMNLYEKYPHIWVLLQVHDSLVGQFPIHRRDECLAQLEEASRIVLPYDDPLIIPTGTKTSQVSWGDC